MESMTLSQIIGTIEQEQDQLLDRMDVYNKQAAKEEYSAVYAQYCECDKLKKRFIKEFLG